MQAVALDTLVSGCGVPFLCEGCGFPARLKHPLECILPHCEYYNLGRIPIKMIRCRWMGPGVVSNVSKGCPGPANCHVCCASNNISTFLTLHFTLVITVMPVNMQTGTGIPEDANHLYPDMMSTNPFNKGGVRLTAKRGAAKQNLDARFRKRETQTVHTSPLIRQCISTGLQMTQSQGLSVRPCIATFSV